jgi:ribonuclease H2 subunit C
VKLDRRKYGEDEDEEEEYELESTTWKTSERFNSLTVWDHHAPPDEKQDHWIRGVQEWIAMAEAVPLPHSKLM